MKYNSKTGQCIVFYFPLFCNSSVKVLQKNVFLETTDSINLTFLTLMNSEMYIYKNTYRDVLYVDAVIFTVSVFYRIFNIFFFYSVGVSRCITGVPSVTLQAARATRISSCHSVKYCTSHACASSRTGSPPGNLI